MGMLLFRTWGSCVVKHGDVVPNVFFIKKAHISYVCCWKKYLSLTLPLSFIHRYLRAERYSCRHFCRVDSRAYAINFDISMNDF